MTLYSYAPYGLNNIEYDVGHSVVTGCFNMMDYFYHINDESHVNTGSCTSAALPKSWACKRSF